MPGREEVPEKAGKAMCSVCNRVWLGPSWAACQYCGEPNPVRRYLWEADQFVAVDEPSEVAEGGEYVSVDALAAIAPAIRNQERQRIQEALLSDSVLEAVARFRHEADYKFRYDDLQWDKLPPKRQAVIKADVRSELLVALVTLDPSGEGQC